MDEAETSTGDQSDSNDTAHLTDVLTQINADRLLVEFLTTAFGNRSTATTAITSDSLEIGAPESRTAVFAYPTHIAIDFAPEVSAQLTEWHGELRLVDSPATNSHEQLVRVKATDLLNPTLRTSLLNAMPGAYERSESRPPLPVAATPVRKQPRARSASPRNPRQPAPAKPVTKDSPIQSWEGICPNCMMVHRVGIDCF